MKDKYGKTVNRNNQNTKCLGSEIYNIDTFRGCPNNCESCYAKRNSAISIKNFHKPVKVEIFVGKMQENGWYRVGNSGDSAVNWAYSEKLIKEWDFKKFFCVTKLQSIKGYTGFFDKLQVSLDPLNKSHFNKTIKNIKYILKNYPKTKIMLRVRTVSTLNPNINKLMDTAVKFANTHDLPIMETRMRFNRKEAIKKYRLIEKNYYMSEGNQIKPIWGKRFLKGAKRYYDCDLFGKKCENCSHCTETWSDKQYCKKGVFIAK